MATEDRVRMECDRCGRFFVLGISFEDVLGQQMAMEQLQF
jgi:hypothetical protein